MTTTLDIYRLYTTLRILGIRGENTTLTNILKRRNL